MTERLQELLEKIQAEGVEKAEKKAEFIEGEARKKAEQIIAEAKHEAVEIATMARKESSEMKTAAEEKLKQAARDLMLSLKNEIRDLLGKVVQKELSKGLSPEVIGKAAAVLIEKFVQEGGRISDVTLLLSKDELSNVREHCLSELKKSISGGLEFRPALQAGSGFLISFDRNKSFFDFSDESLQEALCLYLGPELSRVFEK